LPLISITLRVTLSLTGESNLTVTIGNSLPFAIYTGDQTEIKYKVGVKSISDGNLQFIPDTTFDGTITEITVKEITDYSSAVNVINDSTDSLVLESRFTTSVLGNVFIGQDAGKTNVVGYQNFALGYGCLKNNSGGFWNVAIGTNVLENNTQGSRNVGIGHNALNAVTTGQRNQAIGTFSQKRTTSGTYNSSIGADTLFMNTTGSNNIAIGFASMYSNVSGSNNVAIGHNCSPNNTISNNSVIIGSNAKGLGVGGSGNVMIGAESGYKTTGANNTTLGYQSLYQNTSGTNNVAIGYVSGKGASAGVFSNNVTVGVGAGFSFINGSANNTLIGHQAGKNISSGTGNIVIGADVDTPSPTDSNRLNIGNLITGVISGTKKVTISGSFAAILPEYADNAAALAGGSSVGDFYKTASGDVKVVITAE
jgi:hypothetical protein